MAVRDPVTSSRSLAASTVVRSGWRERVRVELPAGGEQSPDSRRPDPPDRLQVRDLEVEHAGPVPGPQHGQRSPDVAQIAVVEREHDRLRGKRGRAAPGVEDTLERDCAIAVRGQPRDFRPEGGRSHVQLRVGGVGRRRTEHVVHQDRHRAEPVAGLGRQGEDGGGECQRHERLHRGRYPSETARVRPPEFDASIVTCQRPGGSFSCRVPAKPR